MRDTSDKTIWGRVEKLGKGTRANYDPDKKTITFCFNRDPQTSSEQLRASRELLMKELKELGIKIISLHVYAEKPKAEGCDTKSGCCNN